MPTLSSCGEPLLCILISIYDSIRCIWTRSLLAGQSLSLRRQFPTISQSQFLIADASLKRLRTLSAILYLLSTVTTRRRSSYPRTPNLNHSQQHIWRPLALTEVTNLIFDAFCTCLSCPVPFLYVLCSCQAFHPPFFKPLYWISCSPPPAIICAVVSLAQMLNIHSFLLKRA